MRRSITIVVLCLAWASSSWAVTPPTLPQRTVDMTMPTVTAGNTFDATCATLQAVLNTTAALNLNTNYRIRLATGTVCQGPYLLPSHTGGTGWILITGPDAQYNALPPSGTRVTVAQSATAPTIKYGENNAIGSLGAFTGAHGANRYRFIGILAVQDSVCSGCNNPPTNFTGFLSTLFANASVSGTNTGYMIVDRSWYINNDYAVATHQAINMASENGNIAIIDSYIDGVKTTLTDPGSGGGPGDTQCIVAVANAGPILIQNNFLRCSGENIMFGGGGTPSAALVPNDATIRLNTFAKDPNWPLGSGVIKTMMELKVGLRVLIEGNDFIQMPWSDLGYAFRLTPRGIANPQSLPCRVTTEPWDEVSDITIRYNFFQSVTNVFSTIAADDCYGSAHSKRWAFHDNLITDLGYPAQPGGCLTSPCGVIWSILNGPPAASGYNAPGGCTDPVPTCQFENLAFYHNTVDGTIVSPWLMENIANTYTSIGLDYRDNLMGMGTSNGLFSISPVQLYGTAMLNAEWPNMGSGVTWSMRNNRIVCCVPTGADSSNYPQGNGNVYAVAADVTNQGWWTNRAGGDYTVPPTSPAHNAASDGTDQGVNFTAYNAARSGSGGNPTPPAAPTNFTVQ